MTVEWQGVTSMDDTKRENIEVVAQPAGFDDWEGLLTLLRESFAYMEGRIDPPSSLQSFDAAQLAAKAAQEQLVLATMNGEPVGCLFAAVKGDVLYLGKIAVKPDLRGQGIARRMFDLAESYARGCGLKAMELQARIELTENHRTFMALGFVKTGEGRHPGYGRATDVNFRKRLSP